MALPLSFFAPVWLAQLLLQNLSERVARQFIATLDAAEALVLGQAPAGQRVSRAKYRQNYERPVAMVPGQVTRIEFDLRDRYHTFKKGHRIMVQVQSSWFPVIDRNPGTFTNIYHARPSDYRRTTQRVHRSPGQPSHLVVHLVEPAA